MKLHTILYEFDKCYINNYVLKNISNIFILLCYDYWLAFPSPFPLTIIKTVKLLNMHISGSFTQLCALCGGAICAIDCEG